MKSRVSATAAARNFSDLVNRAYYRGESQSAPKPDAAYVRDVTNVLRRQPPLPESPWSR